MITETLQTCDERIDRVLRKCASSVRRVRPNGWKITLANGRVLRADAYLDGEAWFAGTVPLGEAWFVMDAPLDGRRKRPSPGSSGSRSSGSPVRPAKLWQMLRWNASLNGAAKFVHLPDASFGTPGPTGARGGTVALRAEIPLGDEETEGVPAEAIRRVCEDFRMAFARFSGGRGRKGRRASRPRRGLGVPGGAGRASADDDTDSPGLSRRLGLSPLQAFSAAGQSPESGTVPIDDTVSEDEDLERLCAASGWEFSRRASGAFSAQLDPDGPYQARITRRKDGCITVAAEMAVCESLPAVSRQALGLLLLDASRVVHMVRAGAAEETGRIAVRFETVLEARPGPAVFVHALRALNVGCCRLCGREVRALVADETIAREYLTARGWTPRPRSR